MAPAIGAEALLERELETVHLQRAVDHAWHGVGRVVVVQGPAGIGKTTLLMAARRLARDAGMQVRSGRGAELEQRFPFGLVRQLFDSLLSNAGEVERREWLAGAAGLAAPLFAAQAPLLEPRGDESIYPLLHGLYWLCANVARDQPLALLVDDVHWADGPSLAFFGFLARRLEELPILLVIAARPAEAHVPESLGAILGDPSARIIKPAALSADGVHRLLSLHLTDPVDATFASACREATAGNPFLLHELLLELKRRELRPSAGNASEVALIAAHAVADVVLARLRRVSSAARELAVAVAMLGDGATLADASALATLDPAAALEAATAMRTADLLADAGGLAFAHPIIRTSIYQSVLPVERAMRHAAAARILYERGAPAEQVATQLLLAEGMAEPWVIDQLRLAAGAALAVGAPRSAVAYLDRALADIADKAERATLLAQLGHAELLAGLPRGAEHLEQAIETSTDPDERTGAALVLAQMLKFSGRATRAVRLLETLPPAADPILVDRVGMEMLSAGLLNAEARELQAARFDNLRDGGLPPRNHRERFELIALAYERCHANRPNAEALELVRRVGAGLDGPPGELLPPWFTNAVAIYLFCDEYDAADAVLNAMIERSRERGAMFPLLLSLSLRAGVAHRRGRLADALIDATTAYTLASQIAPTRSSLRFHPLGTISNVAVEQERTEAELEQLLEETDRSVDRATRHVAVALLSRARILIALGRPEAALEQLLELGQLPAHFGTANPAITPWRSQAALIMHQQGDQPAAARLAEIEVGLAQRWGADRTIGAALRVQGLVQPEPSIAILERAVGALERSPARLEHARALVDLGAAMRRSGRRAQSRAPLRAGYDLAASCGATKLAEQASTEIAASGARVPARGLSGAESLTPSERRVAELAADGRTNRDIAQTLFVTEKTVETHLGHIYDKLDIRSRHKLRAALGPTSAAVGA